MILAAEKRPKLNALDQKVAIIFQLLLAGAIIHYQKRYWLLAADHRMACAAVGADGKMIEPDEEGNITVIYVLGADTFQDFITWAKAIPEELLNSDAVIMR